MKRITIKDIARYLNLSHTTVSRALNNSPLIKDETKKRIKELAEELNYVPSMAAKGLVLRKSYNIGLFVSKHIEHMPTSFMYEVMDGINNIIEDTYNIVLKEITDDGLFEKSIRKTKYDGILFLSTDLTDNKLIHRIMALNIPLVILNREMNDNNSIYVYADEYSGTFKAVEYLLSLKHKHIAIITGPEIFITSQKRYLGYTSALKKHSMQIKDEYIVQGEFTPDSGYKAMEELLKLNKIPTAVFVSNDLMAIGAIKAINNSGYKVPDDISLIGFDNMDFSRFLIPSLSTVAKSRRKMGMEGASMLLNLINGKTLNKKNKKVETKLIIRESCAELKEENK